MSQKLTATDSNPGRATKNRSIGQGVRAAVAGVLALGLVMGASTTATADVGGGGVGGGGAGSPGGIAGDYWLFTGDGYNGVDTPWQGWGQDSINTFASSMEQQGGWADGANGRTGINTACTTAINQAVARSGGAATRARVVQVGVAVGYSGGRGFMGWGGDQAAMRSWYQGLSDANYWQPNLTGYLPANLNAVSDAFLTNTPMYPRVVCVAMNESEPVINYDLAVSTDKSATFSLAGQTAAVSDWINTSTASSVRENVTAIVTLNWGGVEGNPAAVAKNVVVSNTGTTSSPAYVPSDFGWTSWPAGEFWFDVQIDRQGRMKAGVSHAGRNDPRESWSAATTPPRKVLTSGTAGDPLVGDEVLVSGMSYNAEVTARTNGYASSMTINDTIGTDKVWIGSATADVLAAPYVLDPNGARVAGAVIAIDRTATTVKVSGTVTGIPSVFQAQEYKLVVPTYVLPTKADYTITDDSSVCYTAAQSNCIAGNSAQVRKITQAPDKVWVIDENGALTEADPGKTNQEGVDEKVFAPGATIGAVVNGSVPAKLAENFESYSITDDWSAAAAYIDFTDASKVKVFLNGLNVTDQFDIAISGTTTTATAKAAFLSGTKGLATAKTVKLFIGGKFKLDYETDGKLERLTNSGSEKWNNETIETNTPAIYTVTPNPNKVWVLDENGGLSSTDQDETNTGGADGQIFLQNDAVAAVVNGSIPANLGSPLYAYTLTDDWTEAATYVDFSKASLAKVFYNGVDVTSGFDVNVVGTTTVATAKAPFLASTAGLVAEGKLKLIISGFFRDDYDTNGQIVRLTNAGSETWNDRTEATNSPPVFVWTPDPNKQVLGSADEAGKNAHSDINGASVWPGQKLEYSVGVDLRIPARTARGVKTLAIEDVYDPYFAPDKSSVEFWDSRDTTNPKPVARSAYKLVFDEAAHKFTATFTPEWIEKNVGANGANDQWLTQGWLTMRFTGTVSKSVAGGSTVVNQAFQIINGGRTATEVPTVEIPTVVPEKESLNTDMIDIDGKTVVAGDVILYRLLLDGGPASSELAYNVHKFGLVDDYDEEFLSLDVADVAVVDKATGNDVTGAFNVQVKDGTAYVFAKTVDTEGVYGGIIAGEPQAADLAEYDAAPIRPLEDPTIDQALLGKDYWVTLSTTVTKEEDGKVIENQARQNIQNIHYVTKIVSNPLKDIDPKKDVVISEEEKDGSLNEAEIRMNTVFNYRLDSSEIPANRAYKASQWSISDQFDRVHDQYTGIWAIYANTDVYQGGTLIFKKGALLADSAAHESEPWSDLFTVAFDEATYTFTATANQKYLDLVETRPDLAHAFSAYTKMIRVAPAERIENKVTESYNEFLRDSNTVWTITPEFPEIAVQKYTLEEGDSAGDRDDVRLAYEVTDEQLELVPALDAAGQPDPDAAPVQKGVEVGIRFSNAGDVPLTNVKFADITHEGRFGELEQIMCAVPGNPTAPTVMKNSSLIAPDNNGMIWVQPSSITELAFGEEVNCVGTLRGMAPGMTHGDTVAVAGESIFTGTAVKAEDAWFATAPSTPGIEIVSYTLDEGRVAGDRNTFAEALDLTPGQSTNGVQVGFDVTNIGDEPLKDVGFEVVTDNATKGKVENVQWLDLVEDAPVLTPILPVVALFAEGALEEAAAPAAANTIEIAGATYTVRPLEELSELAVGESVLLVGMLTGVEPGTGHSNVATIIASGLYSGLPVKDSDPWNAKLAAALPPVRTGAVTGDPLAAAGEKPELLGGAALLLIAALVVAYSIRRRVRTL